ncbi:HEAT repeat domain-containing protein [Roseateles cellulosilyticus]|uniref:HEAT repeat domain-containing protein n=1 Tax=Pelomonas cellulosilytica TaxID=2906762 RepID=A0ABS8Y4S2_9BURK|nr:HEAT repeat domain-containing protein [Pelomonas sp. P8]MCE4558238.1 HEAT repeat domain-containing protein [Pelomonas sp. P8]
MKNTYFDDRAVGSNLFGFIDYARRTVVYKDDASFWKASEKFEGALPELAVECTALINRELSAILNNFEYHSPLWDAGQLIFALNANFALSLTLMVAEPKHIFNAVANSCYGVVGRNSINIRRYRLPSSIDRRVFDRSVTLVQYDDFPLIPGDVLRLNSGTDAVDWSLSDPVLMLRFTSASTEALQWGFDRQLKTAWSATAVDPESTQLVCLASYLGKEESVSSLEPLRGLSTHPQHHVRWAAIRAIASISGEAGIEQLRSARIDEHPHIRNAAISALAAIGAQ